MTVPSRHERLVGRLNAVELRLLLLGPAEEDDAERAHRRRELVELVERYRAEVTDTRLPYRDDE